MPLEKPEDFGTSRSGIRVNDYCHSCYRDGAFANPGITMEQMIDRCVAIMAQRGIMPEPKARLLLREVMPGLRRWREGTVENGLEGASYRVGRA